jgi:hypothetical protein
MNRKLVDWDIAFTDVWDDQGHTTKDTGEIACVCGVVEFMMPYVHQGVVLASSIDVNDPTDYTDIFTDLACAGMTSYAILNGLVADDTFSTDDERSDFGQSFYNLCITAINLDAYKTLDLVHDMLESYFD